MLVLNHLKIALRALRRSQGYAWLNVFGLSVGLLSCIMLALYCFDEFTFDRGYARADDIYRAVELRTTATGEEEKIGTIAYNLSAQSAAQLSDQERVTRLGLFGRTNISTIDHQKTFYEDFTIADAEFLRVFALPVLHGDRATALSQPHTTALTASMARRLFGRTDVVGQLLRAEHDSVPFAITCVLRDLPANTHLSFNLLFSEATNHLIPDFHNTVVTDWSSNTFATYYRFRPGTNATRAATQLTALARARRPADGSKVTYQLQPLADIHFYSADIAQSPPGTSPAYAYVFGLLGCVVLLIACINYVNLTTARFASRAKELAVRQVIGARRHELIGQLLTEATLVTLTAVGTALLAARLLLPAFNAFTDKQLTLDPQTDYRVWLGIGLTTVAVVLLAGGYPALYQTRLRPAALLKGKMAPERWALSLRQGLVVTQFACSILMIAATLGIYAQLDFLRNKSLGFAREQLIAIDINSAGVREHADALKAEFSQVPGVSSVAVTSRVPGEWKNIPTVQMRRAGTPASHTLYLLGADERLLPTLDVRLKQGRNLTAALADSAALLLNETAAAELDITQADGQWVDIPSAAFAGDTRALDQPFRGQVVGIVADFHFQSLRQRVAPLVIASTRNPVQRIDYFLVRLTGTDAQTTIQQLATVLAKVDPDHAIEYNFLDQQWERFLRDDARRQAVALLVAGVTILIACLGLFGLATYAAQSRRREIGIRKVLGASVAGIISLLSVDFLKLVLVSAIVALPLAAYALHRWLDDFAYRIALPWWVFAGALGVAALIALLTVSIQAVRAALANPVKSLRTE